MPESLNDTLPLERRWTPRDFDSPRDHEQIIHPRALEPLLHYARKHTRSDLILRNTTLSSWDEAYQRKLFSWAEFLIISQNFFLRFGYKDELLFEVSRAMVHLPGFTIRSAFAGLVADPHMLYHAAARWFSPWTFPCVYPNDLTPLPGGLFDLEIKLKPGFTRCSHFFALNRAMIATSTCMIGLADAVVHMTILGDHARYRIIPPVSKTLFARARRIWDTLWRGGATTVSHLEAQFEALQSSNQELEAKVQELERIQRQLHQTRAKHQRAINGTQEGIWEISLDEGLLVVSPRWLEIVGEEHSREDVVLTLDDWRALVLDQDREAFDLSLEAHLADETLSWEHTFRVARPQGEGVCWVKVRAMKSYLEQPGGKRKSYISGAIADVTLEERTRQDLPLLLQESPYPLCVATSGGAILFANPAFHELLGLSGAQANMVQRVTDFMQPEDWDVCHEVVYSDRGLKVEQRWVMPLHEHMFKEVGVKVQKITLLSGECVLMHIEDLAQIRAEQARQIQMDRIMSMGTMAASIGHEINNPMAFLQSNLELALTLLPHLKEGGEARDDETSLELYEDLHMSLDEAFQGAQRVVKIVRNLRSFTRHTAHSLRSDEAEGAAHILLDGLVSPALSMVRAELAQYARLEIVSELDWEAVLVHLDASSMVQVLTNLLINAAHAVEEAALRERAAGVQGAALSRHCVTLEVREASDRGGALVFVVSDTGVGISPEDHERIFEPFYTSKEQEKGTGLGLYICKMLVEELGGTITLESAQDEGASFTLIFPDAISKMSAVEAQVDEPSPQQDTMPLGESEPVEFAGVEDPILNRPGVSGDKPRLLLVDDEQALRRSFSRSLSEHFQVSVCVDGDKALQELQRGYVPHVILCDVLMPVMNGLELFDEIEASFPELRSRVVFMSGGSSDEILAQILQRGCEILEKPLEQAEILRAVRRYIAH